jgi:phage gpG-like protein
LKAGRGSGFTMPKRTFLDIDKETEREIHNVIDVEFDKFFKQL